MCVCVIEWKKTLETSFFMRFQMWNVYISYTKQNINIQRYTSNKFTMYFIECIIFTLSIWYKLNKFEMWTEQSIRRSKFTLICTLHFGIPNIRKRKTNEINSIWKIFKFYAIHLPVCQLIGLKYWVRAWVKISFVRNFRLAF